MEETGEEAEHAEENVDQGVGGAEAAFDPDWRGLVDEMMGVRGNGLLCVVVGILGKEWGVGNRYAYLREGGIGWRLSRGRYRMSTFLICWMSVYEDACFVGLKGSLILQRMVGGWRSGFGLCEIKCLCSRAKQILGCAGGSSSEIGPCESKEAQGNPLYLF